MLNLNLTNVLRTLTIIIMHALATKNKILIEKPLKEVSLRSEINVCKKKVHSGLFAFEST